MTEQEISPEEVALGQKITDLGNQIKEAKTNGQPKEEWDPLLQQMIAAKVRRGWGGGSMNGMWIDMHSCIMHHVQCFYK